MPTLQDQIKEIEGKEHNHQVVFKRIEKLDSALENIEWVSGLISFAIVVGFFIILYTYIFPNPNMDLVAFLTFYGGIILVGLLNIGVVNPLLKSFVHSFYNINKNEYKSITELKDLFRTQKYEIQKQINEENKKAFRERERKLAEQLDTLVGLAEKKKIPSEQLEQMKKQLSTEHVEIRNFGYQIHTNVYYTNRFTKINEVLLPSTIDTNSTPTKITEVQTTILKTEERKLLIPDNKTASDIKTVSSTTTTPSSNKEKPIPKEEEKDVSELFGNSINEVPKQESKKIYQLSRQVKIDFPKLNDYRHNIGELGELYIFEKEQKLFSNQQNKVIHISLKSDSEGYDIASFTDTGERKYIEVKTTTGNEHEPFYLSNSEMEAMSRLTNYWIYRVYNFNVDLRKGDFYKIDCSKGLDHYHIIQASSFKITPKK